MPARVLNSTGHVAIFILTAVGSIGHALRYYRKEVLRLIAEIGMGSGAMAVIGGTVAIVGFVTLSAGSLIAIQGFASLGNIGVEAFTGFFAALANVRIVAPVVTGQALAATVGAGATAELGAMRISEEIDALEVMGIKSISYLVSTRIVAGFVVIVPLYAMAILLSFVAAQITMPNVLVFTDAAAGKVGELIREEANPNLKLRVVVSGGGCSGFQYGFTFDEKIEDGDFCVENRGVQLLVDPMSAQYLMGAEIDYKEDLQGAQFVIRNPNAKTTCGCGSSFSA